MARDFTLTRFRSLMEAIPDSGYRAQPFGDFLENPAPRAAVLRHDVDRRPANALETAKIQHELGIRASYYFRMVKQSYDETIIKKIADLGHEIGYHYEDLSLARGNTTAAIGSFENNLKRLRQLYPVRTICMHGSPLSGWDNRELWKTHDYKTWDILGEPYYDIDFNRVLYLTDTGRKWNGDNANVRDRVDSGFDVNIRTTGQLIRALRNNELPDLMMLNTHPERWDNAVLPWARQWLMQNLKNTVKKVIRKRMIKK